MLFQGEEISVLPVNCGNCSPRSVMECYKTISALFDARHKITDWKVES